MFEHITDFIQKTYKSKDFISLHEPRFLGNEKKYVNECIDSTFVSSVGRYVDIFEFGNEDHLEWGEYIAKEYLVTTETLPPEGEREYLARAFNSMVYTYPDEMQVILNYGIHNPSYPAPIKLRQYILNTDVQSLGLFESKELEEKISTLQTKANRV